MDVDRLEAQRRGVPRSARSTRPTSRSTSRMISGALDEIGLGHAAAGRPGGALVAERIPDLVARPAAISRARQAARRARVASIACCKVRSWSTSTTPRACRGVEDRRAAALTTTVGPRPESSSARRCDRRRSGVVHEAASSIRRPGRKRGHRCPTAWRGTPGARRQFTSHDASASTTTIASRCWRGCPSSRNARRRGRTDRTRYGQTSSPPRPPGRRHLAISSVMAAKSTGGLAKLAAHLLHPARHALGVARRRPEAASFVSRRAGSSDGPSRSGTRGGSDHGCRSARTRGRSPR